MTRKLLLTAAIVALALAPSIGTETAQARGFTASGTAVAFTAALAAASTADSEIFIRAITDMVISRTATTVTDRIQLAACHGAAWSSLDI
jgi:hypothetical protein